ncbi:CAP domain-containing protein [Salipaludibacillus sp. CUR1]|uniref:CAP domain-containing protein n=1 Tax=Salipaludibacillus sp. CUR1 TaxID=2820003 RepID=UPI001E5B524D|nr:CAP domain-containing protein [Salipaludibacillus sp. CUR1]MCE7794729.1 CAP domain-containing protein [Salipaludibacillus sp. CUR1]
MRFLYSAFSFLVIFSAFIVFVVLDGENIPIDNVTDEENETNEENENSNEIMENDMSTEINVQETSDIALYKWINRDVEDLTEEFGEPVRIDPTPYGYDWYIYHGEENYIQFGAGSEEVITVFTNSQGLKRHKNEIGDTYDEVASNYSFDSEQTIDEGLNSYTFTLTEEELSARPLVHVEDDIWAQLYFDTVEEELSSVRYLTKDVLLMHRPYSLTYTGSLPEKDTLEGEEAEEWESGQARQILDLSNTIRQQHDKPLLSWHEGAAETAYGHSKEMYEEEYFSHTSPEAGSLGDRLNSNEVVYSLAGENIAAQYTDAIGAVQGWLNSEGHRVNLLNDDFTHLGVGVHQTFYTQNFITPR